MRWPILQMCISLREKPMHNWSDALKLSFAKNWNRVTVNIWSQYLQYLQSCLGICIRHLVDAVPLLETENISPVCWYIIEIWPVLMACTWKNRVLLAVFWDKISIFHLGRTEQVSGRAFILFVWILLVSGFPKWFSETLRQVNSGQISCQQRISGSKKGIQTQCCLESGPTFPTT